MDNQDARQGLFGELKTETGCDKCPIVCNVVEEELFFYPLVLLMSQLIGLGESDKIGEGLDEVSGVENMKPEESKEIPSTLNRAVELLNA